MNVVRALGAMLLLCGAACGIQPVELRPSGATSADEIVIGSPAAAAVAQLQAQRDAVGDETLHFLPPAEELVVPADLAPIAFEWRAGKKSMPMPGPGAEKAMPPPAAGPALPDPAAPLAPVAPPAEGMAGPKGDKLKNEKDRVVAYELHAHAASTSLRVYLADESATLPRDRWSQLLRAASGSTLSIELRGVRQDGAIVHAAPLQISVRGSMPAGLFYSFSTTSLGLTRARLADTHDTRVTPPLAPAGEHACVGCHSISRDGKRMLVASAAPAQLYSWPLMSSAALRLSWPSPGSASDYLQGAYDSAATRVAATQSGRLLIFDADSGELLAQSATPLAAAVAAPDWSPDGRSIVLETSAMEPAAVSSIASVQVAWDGRLAELKTLVQGAGDEQLRAPRYSLDGEWIAYDKRMGPLRDARETKLFIVRASGGEPIELRKLAEGAGPMSDARAPAFAPSDQPGHAYLVFSSRRQVGSFVPGEGQRQLFAAELDLSKAAAGEDPSHAAFWLPFQQRSNSYLQAQWAPALQSCTPSDEVCDDSDDDCDGEVDEDCCTPAAESCGDSSDDDCDGAMDEGCGCAFAETCGNQLDDDCDLRIDEKPCMPAPPMKDP